MIMIKMLIFCSTSHLPTYMVRALYSRSPGGSYDRWTDC